MNEASKPQPRRFQVKLRTLFAVTTIVALLAGWWAWNVRLVRQRNELLQSLNPGIASAEYDWGDYIRIRGRGMPCDMAAIRWLLFRKARYYTIELVEGTFSDDDIRQLHAIFPETRIWRVSPAEDASGNCERLEEL